MLPDGVVYDCFVLQPGGVSGWPEPVEDPGQGIVQQAYLYFQFLHPFQKKAPAGHSPTTC